MIRILFAGVAGFVASAVLTQGCKHAALRLGVVSRPRNDRWNRREVPLLGGVAIAAAVLGVLPFVVNGSLQTWAFFAGGAALFLVGLVDDIRELKPWTKVTAEVLVGALLASAGLELRLTTSPIINVLLTIFWVTGVTNALNLLDNMDGLAAGIAAIGALFRLGFFVLDGNLEGATLAALVTGAALGFLAHNFSPASIFMGDAGSLFLGFCVSGLSLVGGYPYSRSLMSVLLLPVLLLLVPIFDTTFVTISRSLARRPLSHGGSDHTSHRLVALGLTPRAAVLSLYGVAALSGGIGVLTYRAGLSYGIVLVVFLLLSVAVLGVYLSRIRVYTEERPQSGNGAFFDLVDTLAHKRQLATLVVDVVLMAAAYYTAYLLRFEDELHRYDEWLVKSVPIVIVCQVAGFWLFKVHHAVWRYAGVRDFWAIAAGALAGTVTAVVAIVFTWRFNGFSRAVFVLDWVLLVGFVSASRLSMRLLGEVLRPTRSDGLRRVLIYGAGDGGVLVCRELTHNISLGRQVVGFLDDDRRKHHRAIGGFMVKGGIDRLESIIANDDVHEVLIASSSISPANLRIVADVCDPKGIAVVHASLKIE